MMVSMIAPLREHSRVYIDDLCTATPTFDTHLLALEAGWTALETDGFKLKPEKCNYGRHQVSLLGWQIDGDGRRPEPSKMDALRLIAVPTTVKELYSGLGLLNYYRNHVHRYADKVATLQSCLNLPVASFAISEKAAQEWRDVVAELCLRFSLNHPTQGGLLRIYTDASDVALGAVLVEYPLGTDMDPMCDSACPDGKVLPSARRFSQPLRNDMRSRIVNC